MGDWPKSDWLSDDGPCSKYYDIVIVGAGPAGLMLATCLSRWGYRIRHIDDRVQPTPAGRADGIQPRSLDILHSMGLKQAIMSHNPVRSYETAFWAADGVGRGIVRTGTYPSCPESIGARYPFTTLLHQGYIEQVFISDMNKRGVRVLRPWTISKFETTFQNPDYPVVVEMAQVNGAASETVRSKYLFSGEGAHSSIRKHLQIGMKYKESTASAWAVIDGTVRSDFPDIRMACSIHGANGSALIIPRERGMVRFYVRASKTSGIKWDAAHQISKEEIQNVARSILVPYFIEWDYVDWYSRYEIRQGVANQFTLDQRVFLGGDSCHVHSPKAGQGMNTAFYDAHNLAWKIHLVEMGFAHRDLLKTYESERKSIAHALINFDNHYASLYSKQYGVTSSALAGDSFDGDSEFPRAYKACRAFVSGYGIKYEANILNWSPHHPAKSACFITTTRLAPGSIFINATVTRVEDANPVHLEQAIPLNGSFRIFIFAGIPSNTLKALQHLSANIRAADSFLGRCTSHGMNRVPSCDKHDPQSDMFTICTVFAAKRGEIDIARHDPGVLGGCRHHIYADDVQNLGTQDLSAVAHARAGLDPVDGGIVVVRPDGFVGAILRLTQDSSTTDALNRYFSAISRSHTGQVD